MANQTVICTYRVRPGEEAAFEALLRRHWATLRRLEFVTDEPTRVFRSVDEPTYVEIFTWADGGFGQAHDHPDVLVIWERLESLCEPRGGRPKTEFPHFTPIDVGA